MCVFLRCVNAKGGVGFVKELKVTRLDDLKDVVLKGDGKGVLLYPESRFFKIITKNMNSYRSLQFFLVDLRRSVIVLVSRTFC